MLRRLLMFVAVLAFSVSAISQTCNLSMTVDCDQTSSGAVCTAVTTNNGAACSGLVFSGWFSQESNENVQINAPQVTLGGLDECVDSAEFGEFFPQALAFCFGETTIPAHSSFASTASIVGFTPNVPIMAVTWVGDEEGNEAGSASVFVNVEPPTCTPNISAPPLTRSGVPYTVSWTEVSDLSAQYIIEESGTPDFTGNVTQSQVNGLSKTFFHEGMATTTTYYYRVRPTNCAGGTPGVSRTAQTIVQAEPPPATTRGGEAAVPFGSTTPVELKVRIPGASGKAGITTTFTATTDQPYLTVTPGSGTLPPEGLELTVTANPTALPPGANTGTVIFTTTLGSAEGPSAQATITTNIPISISLVTPVMPGGKTTPPANALVIPVVTHVNVTTGQFLSDVRLTNAGGAPINYQITMTPTQTNATTSSKVTQVSVGAQQTIALNDIVKNFFGFGATSNPQDIGFGSLEIRPLNSSSLLTYASSRTYASTAGGTFGQFISAVPFTRFATRRAPAIPIPGAPPVPTSSLLSLQQIAQSTKFRTNLGLAEGAGEPASGRIRIFNALGTLLKEIPYSLLPGEHRQMNAFISSPNFGNIPLLEDGRIEVTVDSPTGAVTAYASVLDNVTTDPLAVMPVDATQVRATRYVIPGMAELPNRVDNFHSDLRIYNGGTADTPITLTYFPQGNGAPIAAQPRTVRAGEMLVLDNVLPALFNATNTGGSIVVTTPSESSLVATGRTYTTVDRNGSFGQFIPGVTPAEGVGMGERALQVMQLEESTRFRSNVGFAELTGNPATVRISLHLPDTKTTATTEFTLAPNEFRQLRPILGLNPGKQTYNARITVEVIGGTGRVTAYGSVIDNESKDPTYVPAQ